MSVSAGALAQVFLAATVLAACSRSISTPSMSRTGIMPTASAGSQGSLPAATPGSDLPPTVHFDPLPVTTAITSPAPIPVVPTSTPLVFTDPSIPLSERIVYYYFVGPAETPIPEGTVLAGHHLAPAYADETHTPDTAADLRTALEIVLHDGRNFWRGSDLEIVEVAFRNGHANIVLQGEYLAAGGGPLWAAGWQILMTVFANPSVQTAAVSVNGDTIGNLGLSRSEDARPADHVYTRAEIESFMNENAYVSP